MPGPSEISWTDASWNPVRGCSVVSPGCTNCYAMKQAHRFSGAGQAYDGLTKLTKGGPVWTGKVRLVPELLDWPLRWRGAQAARAEGRPSRVFVNSMSDLFHDDVPDEFIAAVFGVMACSKHVFQILTKRPERMMRWLRWMEKETDANAPELAVQLAANRLGVNLPLHPIKGTLRCYPWPLRNVWLGVSCEDQARADSRVPLLLQTTAAVRFLSIEPLLGPVNIERALCSCPWPNDAMQTRHLLGCQADTRRPDDQRRWAGIDWVIVGGESGPGARGCEVAWIRSVVAQCKAADTKCFVKQLGARPVHGEGDGFPHLAGDVTRPRTTGDGFGRYFVELRDKKGGDPAEWPEALRVREFPS